MQIISYKTTGLAILLALALTGGAHAQAQQHQQHHPGGTQTPQQPPAETAPEASAPEQMQGMMESMQGMMEHMQGMMESMQGMMGGGMMRRHGTMGRRRMGMQQHAQDDDEKEPAPHGMMKRMMQHRSMLGGGGMLGHGGMIQHHLERLGQQLELSAEQRAQMWTLLSPHAKEAIRLRADIEALGLDLRQLLDATPVDFAKVKPVLQTLASREADLRLLHLTAMQELGKVLTAEQQQKLQGIRRRMLEHRGMMGHGQK